MDSHNVKGLCGLVNFGNTCYMNSAIQCLSHIHNFRAYFTSKDFSKDINREKDEIKLVVEWYKVINALWQENSVVKPQSFRNEVRMLAFKQGINLNLVGNGQNDVQEFLLFLISSLHNGLSKKVNMNISGKVVNDLDRKALEAFKSWRLFFKDDYSKLVELFYGQHISNIYSLDKVLLSTTYEPFCYLTLPIPDKNNISIQDCLDCYTQYERLQGDNKWYNEKTKEYEECYKQIKFWNTPQVLIIVLKRFLNSGEKNNSLVDFPLDNLDLSHLSLGYGAHKNKYELRSIANHIGSLGGGHYFAYSLHRDNKKWYCYNDSVVREVSEQDLVSEKAYCLFYEKKTGDFKK